MKTISIKNNQFIIKIPYDITLVNLIKTSFSSRKWDSNSKCWVATINEKNILATDYLSQKHGFSLSLDTQKQIEKCRKELEVNKEKDNQIIKLSKATEASIEIPKLKGEIYPFQKAGVLFMEKLNGRVLLADEMGLGKSLQAIASTLLHPDKRPILVICPATLKINWQREFEKWSDIKTYIISSNVSYLPATYEAYIINYDIVEKQKELLQKMNFQILVLDECHFCFDGGTLITTNKGQIPIKEIVEKQLKVSVLSCNLSNNMLEWKYITNWFKINSPNNLIKVRMLNGEKFICTKEHKVWTKEGYKEIQKVSCGEELFTMPKTFFNTNKRKGHCKLLWVFLCSKSKKLKSRSKKKNKYSKAKTPYNKELCLVSKGISIQVERNKGKRKKKILWFKLCCTLENVFSRTKRKSKRNNQDSTTIKYRQKKPQSWGKIKRNEQKPTCERKNKTKINWENFFSKGGKWETYKTTDFFIRNFKSSNGISYFNNIYKRIDDFFTNMLQSRFSNPPIKNSNRSRWFNSQNKKMEIFRQEENRSLKSVRVESIEIYKSGSIGKTFDNYSKDKFVYDIEVADNHNYFASNILVSNCKNPKAKRTRSINELSKGIPHVLALTGTPILNRPIEIYNILKILSPQNFGNYWEFASRYCGMQRTRWGIDVSGATNIEELSNLLRSTVMIRREKKDVLKELPDKTRIVIPQEIDLKEYKKLEDDLKKYLIEVKNKSEFQAERISRVEQLAKIEYLKQEAIKAKLPLFIEWVKDFLEDNEKLVVFAHHIEFIEKLMTELKEFNPVKIIGGMFSENKQKSIDTFMQDKNCKLILCGIKAAGVGINLTASSYVAFLELGWTPGDHDQAEDRLHRIGQKNNVSCYYFLGKDTIEETIYNLIQEKRKIFTQLMQDKNIISEEKVNIFNDLVNNLTIK